MLKINSVQICSPSILPCGYVISYQFFRENLLFKLNFNKKTKFSIHVQKNSYKNRLDKKANKSNLTICYVRVRMSAGRLTMNCFAK